MNHVLSVPSLKTAQCFKIISLTFTNEKISAPELIWPQILCSSPSSPSSPATLIAGVLCHRPTQQHSCDPVRSPRPEHGGLSAPAVTGSRTTTQHQTSPTSCALCSPRNKSIQLKYHTKILFCTPAGYIAGSTEVKVATEVGKHQDKKSVKGVVRPQQDNRAYSKKKKKKTFALRAPLHCSGGACQQLTPLEWHASADSKPLPQIHRKDMCMRQSSKLNTERTGQLCTDKTEPTNWE